MNKIEFMTPAEVIGEISSKIAKVFRSKRPLELCCMDTLEKLMEDIAKEFLDYTNGRFDSEKFIDKCLFMGE